MSAEIRNLEPKSLWNHFSNLNEVPRPSKKEERVIQFMVNFGEKLGLKTVVDGVGNVIISKPASIGYENRKTIVLQSHLDMVHQKNSDTIFDFDTEGIKMFIDKDWVTAEGTTLGADNGLGVATIMAILSSSDIDHPPIEALFTIDEETGMTGAMGLEGGLLKGEILLNLDTEEDDEIDVGCAGGMDITATKSYQEEKAPENTIGLRISVTGLQGGHSGMDIHKGFGNANKIMNRILYHGFKNFGLRLSELEGGSLRNAIPRESFSNVVLNKNLKDPFIKEMKTLKKLINEEFKSVEPNLSIDFHSIENQKTVLPLEVQEKLIKSVYSALNGVYKMSNDIPDLVETSNNIARVVVKNNEITIACLTRSSSESSKIDLANSLRSCFELSGFSVEFSGSYPGWQPNMNSEILKVASSLYKKLFKEEPSIVACHAGLECGILGQNYPKMDMISFGPTIKGAHSPDEKVSISSVRKFWSFLLEILKNTPHK